jgi:MFS transporter, ACS family, hexuronate transporter
MKAWNMPHMRWIILALVFLAGVLNYVDRQVVAILKPVLQQEFGWDDREFGHLGTAFQFAAAITYIFVGAVIDRIGLRRSYAWGVSIWSLAAMAHAAAMTMFQFVAARIVLAAAEAVHTPASVKAISEWFSVKDRSLAVGINNSASNIGAIIAPLTIPAITYALNWHAAFLITGGLGFVWLIVWLYFQKQSPEAILQAETPVAKIKWRSLLNKRGMWAVGVAKLFTDLVWWFLLFWAPGFLMDTFNLNMRQAGLPLAVIYGMAAIGAFSGGLLPTFLLSRGLSVNAARKLSFLIYALIILPLPLAASTSDPWIAVALIGVALFAHQGFSTNIFAMATDLFPARVVASVISFGALLGNLSGMVMIEVAGWTLVTYKTYAPLFYVCGSVYLIALVLIHLIAPRLQATVVSVPQVQGI